eukprot:gnl/Chilomastix_cuspidata/2368.p1 GENE.gnl/Chilomastix_cuspidata/2368~~gnl/Chilomastix_cuspidata/2368.p1  ORF type:complete len:194 (-),score=56.31 gnl/Chilomastix_cuspidata/2368:990-1571(-)
MSLIPGGKKTALVKDGLKKIHTVFDDTTEVVEEFDLATDTLVVRKWKRPNVLGALGDWEFEVGEDPRGTCRTVTSGLSFSAATPVVVRNDLEECYLFMIRNMPWPLSNYYVKCEDDKIVVRTQNRKFFKELAISDLGRNGIKPLDSFIKVQHHNNTLFILYTKPPRIRDIEKRARLERASASAREGDVQCPTQ